LDEVVVAGETGLLFKPGDPHALAGALLKLIQDPCLMNRMGRAGYELVQQKFQIRTTVEQTTNFYRAVLNKGDEASFAA
jgi:glycosyltransferase involved in cell wall biosynthesis